MLRFVEIAVGTGGGLGCTKCAGSALASFRSLADVTADIDAVAASWSSGPGPNIVLTGVEPFAHPELPAIVAAARQARVSRVRLRTDGGALAHGDNAAGVVAAGVHHIEVVLLAGHETHDDLTGRPGLANAAVCGARAYRDAAAAVDAHVFVSALVRVCQHSLEDTPAAVALALEAGAEHVTLRLEDGGLDSARAASWLVAACDTATVNGVWCEVEGLPLCLLGNHVLHAASITRLLHGTHAPACGSCALNTACPGGPQDATPDSLASVGPPAAADALARRIAMVRAEVGS